MATENKEMEVQEQEMVPDEMERTRECRCYIPRTDIYEISDEIIVVLDMPGINENAIEITVEKNILNVKAYSQLDELENYSLVFSEYEQGDYERSFQISDTIDKDNIKATYKNGVLKIVLAKAEQAKTRKISVKVG
jgi:HSP20 family molecular chaperone IbpA